MKLQDGETILHEMTPEPSIIKLWVFTKSIPAALTGGVLGYGGVEILRVVLALTYREVAIPTPLILLLLFASLCFAGSILYNMALRRTYRYWVTNMRCVFTGGILRRVERSIPFHKITDIEVSRNLLERILGITTLNLFTPGTASAHRAEISFPGLVEPEDIAHTLNTLVRQSASRDAS